MTQDESRRESESENGRQPSRVVEIERVNLFLGKNAVEASIEAQCTSEGWIFSANGKTAGPYTLREIRNLESSTAIARELQVELGELVVARIEGVKREISLDDLARILESTVKKDRASKLVTFLGFLLAQTYEDQFNVSFCADTCTGKSYIPLELVEYFPETDKKTYAGVSPTSFFHEIGEWDKDRNAIIVDLEGKILIFLDNPHWMLMERLRPLLSHDTKSRELVYKITDRSKRGALRTKTVILKGYPSVAFCTTKPTLENQEKTRMILLSPETNNDKILEALKLQTKRGCDRQAFKQWIENHPLRQWLKERVEMIRGKAIESVTIPNGEDDLLGRYLKRRGEHLNPRDQRDYPRLISLVKGVALLNCFTRETYDKDAIIATQTDIDQAFTLYEELAKPNELGLAPETYRIFSEIIEPLTEKLGRGATRREILTQHHKVYYQNLSYHRLHKEILPALESAGLVTEEPDPADKRRMLISPVDLSEEATQTEL